MVSIQLEPVPPAEDDISRPVRGYPSVARVMGEYPELTIFRRFRELNAKNLLYLQAELVQLELRLHQVEIRDSRDPDLTKAGAARDWFWLSNAEPSGDNRMQWQMALKMRELLKQYNHALIQQMQLSQLPRPDKGNLRALQRLLLGPGLNFPLVGPDRNVWGELNANEGPEHEARLADLVGLADERPRAPIGDIIAKVVIPFYHRLLGARRMEKEGITIANYSVSRIVAISTAITTLAACLLPVASATALWYIDAMAVRLAVIAALTAFIFLCLFTLTTASSQETLIITVAYSAIMIIFVGFTSS